MLRSRLRWRALAVLGALLSVMIDWPLGSASAMPTTSFPPSNMDINCSHSADMSSSSTITTTTTPITTNTTTTTTTTKNCSATSLSVSNSSVHVIDSESSDSHISRNISSSDSSNQQIPTTSSEDYLSVNRVKKVNSTYNKRKRKKNVYRVTAATLRDFRTHGVDVADTVGAFDITTISPVTENSTVAFHHLSRTDRSVHQVKQRQRKLNSNLDRNERSANLSHISGPARKVQLFIKNRFIQLMPDGTVNGTQDDLSDYTILQRTTVDVGQIKIQGVATCLYLCMDQCGSVYGSKSFTDDCVFNESMEQHHYNTYSSTFNSNSRRTLYLALNRHGEPRKLQIPQSRSLGKLATYTKALTETVPQERVEKLIAKTFGENRVKHGLRQLCDAGKPLIELTAKIMKAQPECNTNSNSSTAVSEKPRLSSNKMNSNNSHINNNNNSNSTNSNSNSSPTKKKKKKRRCRPDEPENDNCHKPGPQALKKRTQKAKCATEEDCAKRKKKNNNNNKNNNNKNNNNNNHKQQQNGNTGDSPPPGSSGGNRRHKKQNGQRKKNGGNRTTTVRNLQLQTTTTAQPFYYTSTEHHEDEPDIEDPTVASIEEDEDEDISSMTSVGSQTNFVDGADDLLYDSEFEVYSSAYHGRCWPD